MGLFRTKGRGVPIDGRRGARLFNKGEVFMTRLRVHELAKELNMDNKDLLDRLVKLGFQVKNHMSTLTDAAVLKIRQQYAEAKAERVEEKRIGRAVIRRRKRAEEEVASPGVEEYAEAPAAVEEAEPPVSEPVEEAAVIIAKAPGVPVPPPAPVQAAQPEVTIAPEQAAPPETPEPAPTPPQAAVEPPAAKVVAKLEKMEPSPEKPSAAPAPPIVEVSPEPVRPPVSRPPVREEIIQEKSTVTEPAYKTAEFEAAEPSAPLDELAEDSEAKNPGRRRVQAAKGQEEKTQEDAQGRTRSDYQASGDPS